MKKTLVAAVLILLMCFAAGCLQNETSVSLTDSQNAEEITAVPCSKDTSETAALPETTTLPETTALSTKAAVSAAPRPATTAAAKTTAAQSTP